MWTISNHFLVLRVSGNGFEDYMLHQLSGIEVRLTGLLFPDLPSCLSECFRVSGFPFSSFCGQF